MIDWTGRQPRATATEVWVVHAHPKPRWYDLEGQTKPEAAIGTKDKAQNHFCRHALQRLAGIVCCRARPDQDDLTEASPEREE